ncbi:MAG: iron chelate uptake ABC transporter family permease subunit, partial [Chloroflexota bacterium]
MKWWRNRSGWVILPLLAGLLLGAGMLASLLGAVSIPLPHILKMSLNKLGIAHFAITWRESEEAIWFYIRLPRVLGAGLVGAALASAGVLFQGLLRNPMADPYIIGTSAGAAFATTIALLFPISLSLFGFGLVPMAAFVGALSAVLLVYNLARIGGKVPIVSLLLAGFVVSSILIAGMFLLLAISGTLQLKLPSLFRFLMGGISVNYWSQLAIIAPLILGGVVLARLSAFRLNAFALGDEGAAALGLNVEREKILILATGSLLTAAAVSISGLIGFVGLITPHALRLVVGPEHRLLLPSAALAGASFLILADLLARTLLSPAELPVGILTA